MRAQGPSQKDHGRNSVEECHAEEPDAEKGVEQAHDHIVEPTDRLGGGISGVVAVPNLQRWAARVGAPEPGLSNRKSGATPVKTTSRPRVR